MNGAYLGLRGMVGFHLMGERRLGVGLLPDFRRFIVLSAFLTVVGMWLMPAMAQPAAAVTVSFSVYLPPESTPVSENWIADSSSPAACDELLTRVDRPDLRTCQIQQTTYTWEERSSDTLLIVAPI